jgi:hypothetical protein
MSIGLRIFGVGIVLVVAGALLFGRRYQRTSRAPSEVGHEGGI